MYNEADYDRLIPKGRNSVLEMRKDAQLGREAKDDDYLTVASIEEEAMIIHSKYLIAIMPEVIGYYPTSKKSGLKVLGGHSPLIVNKPYRMLGGARPKLKTLRKKYEKDINDNAAESIDIQRETARKKMTIKHIEHLEHELEKVLKGPMEEEELGYTRDPPMASFDMLWLLFRPGELVYTIINDEPFCCMVRTPLWNSLRFGETGESPEKTTLELQMWLLGFNGQCSHLRTETRKASLD